LAQQVQQVQPQQHLAQLVPLDQSVQLDLLVQAVLTAQMVQQVQLDLQELRAQQVLLVLKVFKAL
jgi:hypothetical protein